MRVGIALGMAATAAMLGSAGAQPPPSADLWAPIRFMAGEWKNPKGEVHEHWSIFSYDRACKRIVLRQFHTEGFVNQYVMDPQKSTPTRVVFESEGFENFSNKWRARETYEIAGPDAFTETFELAPPDKPYEVYSVNRFTRAGR